MLKAVKKSQFNKQLLKSSLLSQHQSRSITTHHQYDNGDLQFLTRKDILDTNIKMISNMGVLNLNREHRYNTLTPNYIKNLSRALDTMCMDDNIKLIYITPQKGEHFSNGTDFRTLLHHKKEKNYEKITSYLNDIYNLQTQVSKINKPIVGIAPGHSYNSGAALIQATGLPVATMDSKFCFNEVSFGFIPHGGSTYYLSRLPGEIGTFLALTGLPLQGIDAREFQIVEQIIHMAKGYEEEVAEIVLSMDFPMPNGYLLSNRNKNIPWQKYVTQKLKKSLQQQQNDVFERARKRHEFRIQEEFHEPKDKVPSATANADFEYKKMMTNYAESHDNNEPGYFDMRQNNYANYYSYVMDQVKLHLGNEYPRNPKSFKKHVDIINRCFYPNSVEEIVELLKKEESPFAKVCLEKMDQNSLLSMKLALKMLRNAKNQDFRGVLESEINIALNKIQDNEFDLGVSEILMKPSKGPQKNPGFSKEVSDTDVKSYFAENPYMKEINIGIVKNALLPTRFYYEKYSDQVRLWINDESTTQKEVRDHFKQEVISALRDQGIDIRDRALTQENARNALYKREKYELLEKEFNTRIEAMVSNDKLRNTYFNNIRDEVAKLETYPTDFYKLVNDQIQSIFENAYMEKLNRIFEKSKEAHSLEKRRMYLNFKKFLFHSRIMTYMTEELNKLQQQVLALPFKEIHLKERWDQSYREMEHPEIKKSFLWHLSKVIGKRNITPPELTKQYLTNPEQAKMMSLYTFDKDELVKLRRDILENPDKYEQILTQETDTYTVPNDWASQKILKRKEYDYWYRVLNQGRSPVDSLPYYKEMIAYKDFVENVEAKALDTLKMTVTRLLLDFENQPEVNEVKDFEQVKESKADAFRRLLKLVNDNKDEVQLPQKKEKGQSESLVESKRNVKDIKRIIHNIAEQDKDLRVLFSKQTTKKDNVLINKFRDQSLNSLIQLIEVALLHKSTKGLTKGVLEERYAALANPKNADKTSTSLKILDSYLTEANSENLIKQAIIMVKPFYFQLLRNNLSQETEKVFKALKIDITCDDALSFYLLNLKHPEIRENPTMIKMRFFNINRERSKYIDTLLQGSSKQSQFNNLLSLMGQRVDMNNTDLPLAQREQQLDTTVKQQYEHLRHLDQYYKKQEKKWEDETVQLNEKRLKKPFPHHNPDLEVNNAAEFNFYNYTQPEIDEILEFSTKADQVRQYVYDTAKEFRLKMSDVDWLHIYANSITEYDLSMQSLIRDVVENQEKYVVTNYLQEMQNIFEGNRKLGWEDVAHYANFLKGYYEEAAKATSVLSIAEQEGMTKLLISQMETEPKSVEEHVRQQSVFDMIVNEKYNLSQIRQKSDDLRDEISNYQKIQERVAKDQKIKYSIDILLQQAPLDIQDKVKSIMDSSSEYIDLEMLKSKLQNQEYNDIEAKSLINKERFIQDVRKGKLLSNFINNYDNMKLDVVSLAETRQLVEDSDTNKQFDQKMKNQVKIILEYVDNSLRYVPHSRRKEITLGDFMRKHHYLNAGSLQEFTNDILKNIISRTLGKAQDLQAADVIDWEYANIRTNPYIHLKEDKRVKDMLNKGETFESRGEIDQLLESLAGKKEPDFEKTKVQAYNQILGKEEQIDLHKFDYEQVMRDALDFTKLNPEFKPVKDFFENQILATYCQPEFKQQDVEYLIQKYSEIRLQECLLQPGFKDKLKSNNNGHIYLKVLKEKIADELSLTNPAEAGEFSYAALKKDFNFDVDPISKYNMNEINNLESLGYDKLIQKFENLEKNKEVTHENFFDKLLQDYFLQKRGQYVKSKELLDELNKQFGGDVNFEHGRRAKTNDPKQENPSKFTGNGQAGIAFRQLQQDIGKQDLPIIRPSNFNSMMELDIATAQALQNNKNGLAPSLRNQMSDEDLIIPEYFDLFDPRKPVKKYVEDKLENILQNIFEVRRKVEKTLTRRELLAYDTMLSQYLLIDTLLPRLKQDIEDDFNSAHLISQMVEMKKEDKFNEWSQFQKGVNYQAERNQKVKNEDALYKFLAFSGMLEKKRREELNKTRKDIEMAFGIHDFDEYYKEELRKDSMQEPRKIDPNEFQPKKINEEEVFMTTQQREEDYFKKFELYKENKKEQHERTQLFFVLEQFFAKTKQNPDPLNKAQQAIENYFKDTENTYFFDKNKIQ